ncbi:autotransporter outer membrane beta-barrel domain-containing protein [Aquisalimonas sp.]|uniref:autotransporter outer membrane beta-barrel domain-containing protein n=1 Tax=Aquisalimonas sp. TaxID=1872621 RepID=UPI0025B91110|nr:autotransporter outer membrane beta-barrel domain-containing protein [Aquisalimonas sp.]
MAPTEEEEPPEEAPPEEEPPEEAPPEEEPPEEAPPEEEPPEEAPPEEAPPEEAPPEEEEPPEEAPPEDEPTEDEPADGAPPASAVSSGRAPEVIAAQGRASVMGMRQQLSNLSQRMQRLRDGASGLDVSGLTLGASGQSLSAGSLFDDRRGGTGEMREFSPYSEFGLGAFINGSAAFGNRDSTDSRPGFSSRALTLTGGADYRFTPHFVGGAALGVTQTTTNVRNGGGGVELEGFSAAVFGSQLFPGEFYLDGIAILGRNRLETERPVLGAQVAQARPAGTEYALGLRGGRDFIEGPWTFSLQSGIDYVRVTIESYDESPSDPDGPGRGSLLSIDRQAVESLTLEGAIQASYAYPFDQGILLPTARLGLERELSGDSRSIGARFQDQDRFTLRAEGPDRTRVNVALGVSGYFTEGRSASLFLESVEGLGDERLYRIDAGVRMEF